MSRDFVRINEDDLNWIKGSYKYVTNAEMARELGIGLHVIKRILRENGCIRKHRKQKVKAEVPPKKEPRVITIYDPQAAVFEYKVKKLKEVAKKGLKIGDYTIDSAYPHHCVCITPKGHRESFTYVELSKFI